MAASLLEVQGVRRSFGGLAAVDGVDIDVPEGRVVGLIGPNGAGKSTLFDCIAGTLKPDAGTVRIGGVDVTGQPAHRVARHGLVRSYQAALPAPRLTVMENVLLGGDAASESMARALLGRKDRPEDVARAHETLAFFGLEPLADAYAGHLSGGQRKLLDLARVWMARPRVMLLDEPLAGVAPALRRSIRDRLARMRAAGATILLVEHDLETVFALCDEVVGLAQGRVLVHGPPDQVRQDKALREAYLGA